MDSNNITFLFYVHFTNSLFIILLLNFIDFNTMEKLELKYYDFSILV